MPVRRSFSEGGAGALVFSTIRVHRIPPRVRDDREPPSFAGGDDACNADDLPDGLSGIFLQRGLDRKFSDLPVGQTTRGPVSPMGPRKAILG